MYQNKDGTFQKNKEVKPVKPVLTIIQISREKIQIGYISTMSQGFKRSNKREPNSQAYLFMQLIQHIQEMIRSTWLGLTIIFHACPDWKICRDKAQPKKKEASQNKSSPIFLEAILAIETIREPQYNKEDYFKVATDKINTPWSIIIQSYYEAMCHYLV